MRPFLACILLIALVGIRVAYSKGKKCKCADIDQKITNAFEKGVPSTEFEEFKNKVLKVQSEVLKRLQAIEEPPTSCYDLKNAGESVSGVYSIDVNGKQISVFCDMDTEGGGWTVFQRHKDNVTDFYRTFREYEDGFGSASGSYWLGLKSLNEMTQTIPSELYFKFVDRRGFVGHEQYGGFSVSRGPEYTLNLKNAIFTQNISNVWNLMRHNGMKFSTKDKDQDTAVFDCANNRHGGFWYANCGGINPNGQYVTPGTKSKLGHYSRGGMVHVGWRRDFSLKETMMMFRRSS